MTKLENQTLVLPISKLKASPNNLFRDLEETELQALAESIEREGLLHPLVVRQLDNEAFEVVSGHQRLRAAERLGLEEISCTVVEADDIQAELMLIAANTQTRQLGPMEMARAIRRQKELLGIRNGVKGSMTSAKMAELMETSERHLRRLDKLNDLIPGLQALVESGQLKVTAGEVLAGLPTETQSLLLEILGDSIAALTTEEVRRLRRENEHGYSALEVLKKRTEELEQELEQIQQSGKTRQDLETEIRRLTKKRVELEYDIMDRENAAVAVQERELKSGAAVLSLLEQLLKPVQAARPELITLLQGSGDFTEPTVKQIEAWANVLKDTACEMECALSHAHGQEATEREEIVDGSSIS